MFVVVQLRRVFYRVARFVGLLRSDWSRPVLIDPRALPRDGRFRFSRRLARLLFRRMRMRLRHEDVPAIHVPQFAAEFAGSRVERDAGDDLRLGGSRAGSVDRVGGSRSVSRRRRRRRRHSDVRRASVPFGIVALIHRMRIARNPGLQSTHTEANRAAVASWLARRYANANVRGSNSSLDGSRIFIV